MQEQLRTNTSSFQQPSCPPSSWGTWEAHLVASNVESVQQSKALFRLLETITVNRLKLVRSESAAVLEIKSRYVAIKNKQSQEPSAAAPRAAICQEALMSESKGC